MRPKRATQVKKIVGLCPCVFCRDIATELIYSSIMALSGISAALSAPIQSYCPPTQDLTFVLADDNHDLASAIAAVACVGNDNGDDDTAAVADHFDYEKDEADDYDDDAVAGDKDGHFVSTAPGILPGGKSLPFEGFVPLENKKRTTALTSSFDHSLMGRAILESVVFNRAFMNGAETAHREN
ncbi:hypothetical protein PoB_001770000 [Plakobranchus ocellatus]|uniref:Uncharacterized protein n=1 Tax=Plakobranchus ocellatus TaxID=259542 RepID=A0AAV3Z9J1_9GAST|nr:hypothetical protein PoB_001770000 [Plakobranchus ocellatus]